MEKIIKPILSIFNYLYIILFTYTAVSKFLDFNTFQNQLGQSPVLSAHAYWISWLIPTAELLIALFICIKKLRLFALYSFYIFMVMFTAYIIIILNFTSFTPCSCGGVIEELGWTEHLIFNIAFIILSAISVVSHYSKKTKPLLNLTTITILGVSVITLIFISSEKQIKRNNAFIRRYYPHPIQKIGEYRLNSNTYYIAGIDQKSIYLANYNAPLYLLELDHSLSYQSNFRMTIDSTHYPYRKVKTLIKSPYFYLTDGTVPVIFKGNIDNWDAKIFSYRDAYFSDFVIMDSLSIGIKTKSAVTHSNAIGILNKSNNLINFELNDQIIKNHKQEIKGNFDSDGMLLWNEHRKQFIYVYYYLNKYEVFDKNLSSFKTGKTIDTISRPIIDVAHYTKNDKFKLGGNSIIVNRQSTTYHNNLYIHSDRLGRYEKRIKSASIIDVYDLTNNTYKFSFYLYHKPGYKIIDYRLYNDLLIAIVSDQLLVFKINQKYFQSK